MYSRPTMKDAEKFYTDLLTSLMCEVDQEGRISGFSPDGEKDPITLNDETGVEKRLILPTERVLRHPISPDSMAFHPLSESAYRGQSIIIKKLKRMITSRLNVSAFLLISKFIDIACDQDYHSKLTSKQTKLLELIPSPDEKTPVNLGKVITSIGRSNDNQLFTIYLKHGGKYKGEECSRLGVVNFPIFEQLEDEKSRTVCGVKLRINDFTAIKSLLHFIFPNADMPEAYNHGVIAKDNLSAPYFRALMGVYYNLAKRLNELSHLYKKHLDDYEVINIPLEWENGMEHIDAFRELIPPLEGNAGVTTPDTPQQPRGNGLNTPANQQPTSSPEPEGWEAIRQKIMRIQNPHMAQTPATFYQQPPQPQTSSWHNIPQPMAASPVPPGYYTQDPRVAPTQPNFGWPQMPMSGQNIPVQQPMTHYPQQAMYGQYGGYQQPPQQPQPVAHRPVQGVPKWAGFQS